MKIMFEYYLIIIIKNIIIIFNIVFLVKISDFIEGNLKNQ